MKLPSPGVFVIYEIIRYHQRCACDTAFTNGASLDGKCLVTEAPYYLANTEHDRARPNQNTLGDIRISFNNILGDVLRANLKLFSPSMYVRYLRIWYSIALVTTVDLKVQRDEITKSLSHLNSSKQLIMRGHE